MEEKREEKKLGLSGEDVKKGAPNPAGLFQAMGNEECDAEAIAASEDGRLIQENMKVMAWGEDSEEEMEFWAKYEKGLKKELHGDPENVHSKWSSFLPLAAVEEMETGSTNRKFPLIFCLHGAHNPIQLTESYGVMQVAAREECIVIAPENENLEHILGLLEYAKVHYPVDESRVYSIGYSFGGFMTSRNVLSRPDIFAGAGMGGMLFAGDVCEHELDGQYYPEYKLTEEMLAKAEELEMPALLFMGENEMLCLEPLWRDQPPMPEPEAPAENGRRGGGVIPLGAADKQKALNNWRRVGGAKPEAFQGQEFYENHDDPVVKSIGAEFERTEVREYHGRKYFIGDSLNDQGECLFRTVSCEGTLHWPTTSYAELVWEQIGKFARDTKTGKLIRL